MHTNAFQSSPVPKDGCNFPSRIATGTSSRCFNPHPSRRTGATQEEARKMKRIGVFQSSPVPKDGCNKHGETRFSA